MSELDHMNPTPREKELIDQYNKALETVARVAKQRDDLLAQASRLPTRAALLDAVEAHRQAFVYLSEHCGITSGPCRDCIDDALSQIGQLANLENEQQMEQAAHNGMEQPNHLDPANPDSMR